MSILQKHVAHVYQVWCDDNLQESQTWVANMPATSNFGDTCVDGNSASVLELLNYKLYMYNILCDAQFQ